MKHIIPNMCPSCGAPLQVKRLECPACETQVEGRYALPVLSRLAPEDQLFVVNLIKTSGSLKELAKIYGISYPTVRNRLDALIKRVQALEATSTPPAQEKRHDA